MITFRIPNPRIVVSHRAFRLSSISGNKDREVATVGTARRNRPANGTRALTVQVAMNVIDELSDFHSFGAVVGHNKIESHVGARFLNGRRVRCLLDSDRRKNVGAEQG